MNTGRIKRLFNSYNLVIITTKVVYWRDIALTSINHEVMIVSAMGE